MEVRPVDGTFVKNDFDIQELQATHKWGWSLLTCSKRHPKCLSQLTCPLSLHPSMLQENFALSADLHTYCWVCANREAFAQRQLSKGHNRCNTHTILLYKGRVIRNNDSRWKVKTQKLREAVSQKCLKSLRPGVIDGLFHGIELFVE